MCLSCPYLFSRGMRCGLFRRSCRGGAWGVRHADCVDEAALDVGRGARLGAAAPGKGTGLWWDGLAQTFLCSHEYLWAPEKAQSSSAALIPWLKSFFLICGFFFLRGEDGVGVLVWGFFLLRMRRFQYTATVVKTIHVHHSAVLEEYSALRANIWEQSDRKIFRAPCAIFRPWVTLAGLHGRTGTCVFGSSRNSSPRGWWQQRLCEEAHSECGTGDSPALFLRLRLERSLLQRFSLPVDAFEKLGSIKIMKYPQVTHRKRSFLSFFSLI